MSCFSDYLRENSSYRPDHAAVISEDRVLSYRQLDQDSNRLANALIRLGLGKGNRAAVLMKSSVDWCVVWYACQKLGVAVVPLHVRLPAREHVRTADLAGVTCLFYSNEYLKQAQYICENSSSLRWAVQHHPSEERAAEGVLTLDELIESGDSSPVDILLDGSETAVILFTSGTTGKSKGVLRTQNIVCSHAEVLAGSNTRGRIPETVLTPAPLYHTAGLFCIFKTAALGGTLVLVDGFDPERICAMIEKYSVTQLLLVPPVSYDRLYYSGFPQKYRLDSINLALVTAGKCTDNGIMRIFEMFPNAALRPSWGATETCSCTGANLSREELLAHPERMRTVGKVNPAVEIRLVDEQGHDVPQGVAGEALVRSSMVFSHYLGAPENREKYFDGDWFRTEDIMKQDEYGFYYLMDRKRDIVKTGGENVYAQEIERVIQEHPSIHDCAVVGVPDERFGEAIAAAVALKPGERLNTDDFLEFCRERLPSFKKPRYLAVLDALPTNSVGKVQKTVLRRRAKDLFSKIC